MTTQAARLFGLRVRAKYWLEVADAAWTLHRNERERDRELAVDALHVANTATQLAHRLARQADELEVTG